MREPLTCHFGPDICAGEAASGRERAQGEGGVHSWRPRWQEGRRNREAAKRRDQSSVHPAGGVTAQKWYLVPCDRRRKRMDPDPMHVPLPCKPEMCSLLSGGTSKSFTKDMQPPLTLSHEGPDREFTPLELTQGYKELLANTWTACANGTHLPLSGGLLYLGCSFDG